MFSHPTVRGKLTLAFSALSLLVLLVAGLSLNALSRSNDRFVNYVNGIDARSDLANGVRTAVDRRAIAERNLVLLSKPEDLAAEKAEVTKAHADVQDRLGRLNKMVGESKDESPQSRALISDINRIEQTYGKVALEIVALAEDKKIEEAVSRMNAECRPMLAQLIVASRAYQAETDRRSRELTAEAAAQYTAQRNLLVIACVVALAAAGLAGVLIVRSLTKALGAEPSDLGMAAKRIADGDLGRVPGVAEAPAGSVLASLGAMQASLAGIVGRVRGASESIATGSSQISMGNADLSQRTEEQASSLQQTAATMDQLGATVRNNADNAKQANQLALGASTVATRGGDVVSQVVDTMKGINDSSKKIADIISVIDGIAFQTNILALNAAVEAARAGEQGRGFAVVASEVRSLAQRSADAAKEIKVLITASVERVEAGTVLVDQAGSTMTEIVASIKRVSDIVGEITHASSEQSVGVSQIGQSITQMDQVTQQNAALVEQSAAAAESLKLQAQQLVQAVSVFRLVQADAKVPALA